MAKKTAKKTRKPRIKRSTNRTVAQPKYHESRRETNKNVTKARVILDNSADAMKAAAAHVVEFFGPVARKFSADEKYGRQHYNQDGFIHPDGVLRLSNESIALMILQGGEVLAQRASQKGNKAFAEQMGEGGDPAAAQKAIDMTRRFLNERPAEIKKDQKAGIYGSVMDDLGIEDASEIVPKAKPAAKKKTAAKKSTAKKDTAAASASASASA